MYSTSDYQIIAFPQGTRKVIGRIASVTADSIVAKAQRHSRDSGDFIDVERDGVIIATVGPDGPV